MVISIIGGVLGIGFLVAAGIGVLLVSAAMWSGGNGAKESDAFQLGSTMLSPDAKYRIFLTCASERPIRITDVYVDGHAAEWTCSGINYGFMGSAKENGKPLNEVKKGEWVMVESRLKFAQITIESDSGKLRFTVPSSKWRY